MRFRKQLRDILSFKERFWSKRRLIHPREEVNQVVHEIRRFLASRQPESLRNFLAQFHPADIALAMRFLHDSEKEQVFKLLDDEFAAEVLDEADEATERHLVKTTSPERLSDILETLPPDESADIIATLEPEERENILKLMEPEEAEEVKELLQYPPDTAGGIMSPDFIAVKETMTVSQVIEMLRERADVESIFYVYVVDDEGTLKGVLNLRRLIVSPPDTQISEIMNHGVIFVFPEQDQEEVAHMFARYDLLALPVVDHSYKLIGVITVDDVMDVLQEELTEDYFMAVGSDAAELEKKRPTEIARLRLPWLTITVCIELIAGFVIHRFDKTLGQLILLASFMPVIQAISGNTGLQSATIVVRGLATGHVTLRDWIRPVVRQLQTTTILGIILGSALFSIAGFWRGLQAGTTLFDPVFGFVVGFSMFITINLSGFVGTVVPMISKRLGFDLALTAGPFETAIQDVVSVTILLGLATLLLRFMA